MDATTAAMIGRILRARLLLPELVSAVLVQTGDVALAAYLRDAAAFRRIRNVPCDDSWQERELWCYRWVVCLHANWLEGARLLAAQGEVDLSSLGEPCTLQLDIALVELIVSHAPNVEFNRHIGRLAVQARGVSDDQVYAWLQRAPSGAVGAAAVVLLERGNLALLQRLYDHAEPRFRKELDAVDDTVRIARHGCTDVLLWVYEHLPLFCLTGVVNVAAKYGQLAVIEWVHANCREEVIAKAKRTVTQEPQCWSHAGGECDRDKCELYALDMALKHGRMHVVDWLEAQQWGHKPTTKTITEAAGSHSPESLQWLRARRTTRMPASALQTACQEGHVDVVRWLCEHDGATFTSNVLEAACTGGHVDVVRLLCEQNGATFTPGALEVACKRGDVDIVCCLCEQEGATLSSSALKAACELGHLSILKWASEHRPLECIDIEPASFIPSHNVALLQWLYAHPQHAAWFDRSSNTEDAAKKEQLTQDTLAQLEWPIIKLTRFLYYQLREPRQPQGSMRRSMLDNAVRQDDEIAVLRWMCEQDADWPKRHVAAFVEAGHPDALQMVLEHGAELPPSALTIAAKAGQLPMMRWLYKHQRDRVDVAATTRVALQFQKFGVLPFLLDLPECPCMPCAKMTDEEHAMDWAKRNDYWRCRCKPVS